MVVTVVMDVIDDTLMRRNDREDFRMTKATCAGLTNNDNVCGFTVKSLPKVYRKLPVFG